MLLPKKTKYRKQQRGRRAGASKGQTRVQFGDFGLKSMKGAPEHWVAVIKPGRVMFELSGVPEDLAKEALRLAGTKLPVKTKFVKREADLFAS